MSVINSQPINIPYSFKACIKNSLCIHFTKICVVNVIEFYGSYENDESIFFIVVNKGPEYFCTYRIVL